MRNLTIQYQEKNNSTFWEMQSVLHSTWFPGKDVLDFLPGKVQPQGKVTQVRITQIYAEFIWFVGQLAQLCVRT